MSVANSATRSDAVPVTRAAWAADRLREAILFAEMKPQETIPEARLAREWGISPTPLREALRRLAADGLVELRPQQIPRVAPLSVQEQIEVYSLRLVIEPLALRMAIEARPESWEVESLAMLDAIRAAEAEKPFDPRTYEAAHRAFHRHLMAPCGSTTLMECLEGLWNRSMRARYVSSLHVQTGDLYDSHRVLHETALRGDLKRACEALDEHILLVLRKLLTAKQLDSVWQMRTVLAGLGRELNHTGLIT